MKINKIACGLLLASCGLIAAGCVSCTEDPNPVNPWETPATPDDKPGDGDEEGDDPEPTPSDKVTHYDNLEEVVIPTDLSSQIKEYTGFVLSYNKDNHTPNYVAWELLATEANGSVDRNNFNYWVDTALEGCLDTDYAYSTYGYERGHMCPAADQRWSEQAMKDCMVMANMCPQLPSLNGGGWAKLETKEREWAKRDSAIMIVAGPIYTDEDNLYIGRAKARVPGAFFKAFLAPYVDKPRAIAFIYPKEAPGSMQGYAMSVDELEETIGFDLFTNLPKELQDEVEATFSFAEWDK